MTDQTNIMKICHDLTGLSIINLAGKLSAAVESGDQEMIARANADFQADALKATKHADAHRAHISVARELYTNDELEIDDAPLVSPGEDGCFVAAWAWVTNDEVRVAKANYTEPQTVIVVCRNASGMPDVFKAEVTATQDQVDGGVHYDMAEQQATDAGYQGPFICFDRTETAPLAGLTE